MEGSSNTALLSQILEIPIVRAFLDHVKDDLKETLRHEMGTKLTSDTLRLDEPLINTKELCEYLRVTEPTVMRYRDKGIIPFMLIGDSVRFQKSAVVTALQKHKKK